MKRVEFGELDAVNGCRRALCPFPCFLCALVVAAAPARLVAALLWTKARQAKAELRSSRKEKTLLLEEAIGEIVPVRFCP